MMYVLFFPLKGPGLETFFGEAGYDVLQIFLQNPIQNPIFRRVGRARGDGREEQSPSCSPARGLLPRGLLSTPTYFTNPSSLDPEQRELQTWCLMVCQELYNT